MKYFANFNTNNGTSFMKSIEGTNKWELLKDVRSTAMAERFQGNYARWWVTDESGNDVFCESYEPNIGYNYTVYNYKEK